MRWLIVEDALRDRKGHWAEYLRTFWEDLRALGDDVTVLTDRRAESFILEQFEAHPILPESIWNRMGDHAGALKRYFRVPWHAYQTWRSVSGWLKRNQHPDVIFVPTVLVHHLLGWAWLVKYSLCQASLRVLLFFPNLPIRIEDGGRVSWISSPTTQLMRWLFQWLRPEILSGRVILGVETHNMREALMSLTELPVKYFPHPVKIQEFPNKSKHNGEILMACYGAARYEKGSDLVQEAILQFLERFPESKARFAIQWIDGFLDDHGKAIEIDPLLRKHDRVEIIDYYFSEREYQSRLAETDIMLLPYRPSSYALRVSRVVIEAITSGIPVVVSAQTTLAEQAAKCGMAILCHCTTVDDLVKAMRQGELFCNEIRQKADSQKMAAQKHFSVNSFRSILVSMEIR